MSAESPYRTDLTIFRPARPRLIDFLAKDLQLPSRERSRFYLVHNRHKVNALNGLVRRAGVESFADNPSWKNLSTTGAGTASESRAKMLGPIFNLRNEPGFGYFRFYVELEPSKDKSPFVQLVKNDPSFESNEIIGGPKFVWLPDGTNGNVDVLHPDTDERLVTKKNAGLCAIQGLAAVYYPANNFHRDYMA